jgi:hypothetical protein
VSGRHRRGWPDRVPLLLVPAVVVGAPIGVVWLAAGLFLLVRLAVRSL